MSEENREENLGSLLERIKAADLCEPSNVLHQSNLQVTYFFWVDERVIDGEPCEALNYAFLSKALPEGCVWRWAPLPKFPAELGAEKEATVKAEIEATRLLWTESAVAEHGRLLLLLAR